MNAEVNDESINKSTNSKLAHLSQDLLQDDSTKVSNQEEMEENG